MSDTNICPVCGGKTKDARNRTCSIECYNVYQAARKSLLRLNPDLTPYEIYMEIANGYRPRPCVHNVKKVDEDQPTIRHKCCDCGAITPDHRCPKCLAKWRLKHNVTVSRGSDGYFDDVQTTGCLD